MRGVLRGCLVQLTLWTAITAAFQFWMRSVAEVDRGVWPVSIATALAVAIALILLGGVLKAARERKMLAEAMAGTTPADGAWIAVSGEISSTAPVRGPLSGEPVVAYEYKITRDDQTGRNRTMVTYFDGKALAASGIATRHGVVRLLSVPQLEVEAAHVERTVALSNAREYIRTTTFENRETSKQRTDALEREWADDDGVFRIDKRYVTRDVDLTDGFDFEERQLRQREPVCAFGVYSAARRGLVPDEKWGRTNRVMRGNATDAARKLVARMVRYTIAALIFGAIGFAGALAYIRTCAPSSIT